MQPEELASAIKRLIDWAEEHAPEPEPEIRRRLRSHFGDAQLSALPIVSRPLREWDRPNIQVALDAWIGARPHELIGVSSSTGMELGLAEVVRGTPWEGALGIGVAEYVTVGLGGQETIVCVRSGIWLLRDGDRPLAIMIASVDRGMGEHLALHVMGSERAHAEAVVAALWKLMNERNVYRGRVVELRSRQFMGDEGAPLTVRALPLIARDQIVLPEGVLERIERTTFGIARHAQRLRASGRHLRRGLLLHGPPGTGKTLTAMYLATQMAGRTVVLLTGRGLGTIGDSVDLATALQPSIVVLEDVDLVAMERSHEPTNALLFELLNAMDGMDTDHDVLFVLTTNQPERIEPALAARPGRIDQAVELPLPDAVCRRRLLDLYGSGLNLALVMADGLVAQLEGTSPAFIRELLRRAALVAFDESPDGEARVTDRHVLAALGELRSGDSVMQSLLGGG